MGYYHIKRRPLDTKFSNYIRKKSNWKCEFCGKVCRINGIWVAKLEASHYIGRRKESVRFDPDNVNSLCFTCHKHLGGYHRDENGEYDLWMKKKLGDKRYRALILRANLPGKKDDFLTNLYINDLIKNNVQSL